MKIITIIITALLLSLIGCSSNQVNKHQNATAGNSNESNNISSVIAAENIMAFENADPKTVIVPYIALLAKLDVVDDAEICLPKHIQTYNALYELNQSSLVAMTMLIACDVENKKKLRNIQELYLATMELLLKKNNGSSKDKAVPIREFSEVEIILTTGEYRIIDYEIIEENNHFYYRVHAIDERTGDFEYHYYNNFPFLKKTYLTIKSFTSDAALSKFILSSFLKISNPAAINYITTQFLGAGEYEKIIEYIKDSKAITPISRLNLARSYLYTSQDNKLDSLLDDLVAQNDDGDINAGIFLVELLERLNGGKASQKDIQLLLDDVDQRTFAGNGSFLLAKANYNHGDLGNFEKWSDVSLEINSKVTYSKLISFLKRQKGHDALVTLLRKQHEKNNLQATFDLANAYHYGQGVIVDHKVENGLYMIASEQGHVDSMYNLANNFENAKFVTQDIDKALYWFKKAGTARSLNQVGYIYYEGVGGIDVDYSEAMKWFQKASDLGNIFSTSNLGLFYQYGKGVEIDYAKAIGFYKAGITTKYLVTYKRLGDIYQYSLGEKYYKEAKHWYEKGADKGHVGSQLELADMYSLKLGNESKAIFWYDQVAKSKDGKSIGHAARRFETGEIYLVKNKKKAIELYQKSVLLGDAFSQDNLGYLYMYGLGIEKDIQRAISLYLSAIEQGSANAMNNLARYYINQGKDEPDNLRKAIELYKKSSNMGNKRAHFNLARKYLHGEGVEIDYLRAFELFQLAAQQKIPGSYYYLGDLYFEGKGPERDFSKAREYFLLGVQNRSSSSAIKLGLMYDQGLGVARDEKKVEYYFGKAADFDESVVDKNLYIADRYDFATERNESNSKLAAYYYEKSANSGNARAQVNLGFNYETGNGVEKNLIMARKLYEESAQKNEAQGINNLATFYKDGKGGLKIDLGKAFTLYSKASDLGNKYAHNNLAKMYFRGENVNRDFQKAFELFKKAAELNFEESYFYLGDLYMSGDGGTKDYDLARNYFEKSVAYGDGDSADNLGVMYSQGMGEKKDLELSANYFKTAAELHEIETDHETYIANKYYFGTWGTARNFSYAKKYYAQAIKKGSTTAMNNLGEMYRLGQGVSIDYQEAIRLYKQAIEKNDEVAMFNMSEFYRDGLGVKKNVNKEFEWMERSANSGFLPAYVELSRMYKNATGTNKDIIKSIEWLKKGVEEELLSAFYEMSRRLYAGDEIDQNKDEAKRLMQVAADAGNEKALEAIESNFKDME